MRPTVLVIDDDPGVLAGMHRTLERRGYDVETASTGRAGLDLLPRLPVDMVLLDLNLPDQDGLSVLSAMRASDYNQPVVMISGEGTVEVAVKAVQLGAVDFIQKPIVAERVLVSVSNALKFAALQERNAELEAEKGATSQLLGDSPVMQRLRAMIDKSAPTEGRVLITGENGTGKELVAAAIHEGSRRAGQPFIRMSCAAVPRDLVESELFGHEKGAFTGAASTRRGRFELADGGTLLLDEIGEMPADMQAKVLRVLQEGELERVGGSAVLEVDVRVIAATNRDLESMIEKGEFRQDLYYRLNVIHIATPPLRDHIEDVPLLCRTFVHVAAQRNHCPPMEITDSAVSAIAAHDFPGNVRELQNLIERMVILADDRVIDTRAVAQTLAARSAAPSRRSGVYRPGVSFRDLLEGAQRQIIEEALDFHGHKMADTARSLELERSHLYKKCKALGVFKP